jgi:DNA-directed RNA polymerase subunit K/omega
MKIAYTLLDNPMIDRSKLPNSFEFVVTAGARARQLLAGSTPRVAVGDHKKTTIAQQEVQTRAVEKVEKVEKVERTGPVE